MARKADIVVPEIEVGRRASVSNQHNSSRLSSPSSSPQRYNQNDNENLQKLLQYQEQNKVLTKRNHIFSSRITELENKIKQLNKEIVKLKENENLNQSLIEVESFSRNQLDSLNHLIQSIRQKNGLNLLPHVPGNSVDNKRLVKVETNSKTRETIPQYFKKEKLESSKLSSSRNDKFINVDDESDYEDEDAGVKIGVFAKQRSAEPRNSFNPSNSVSINTVNESKNDSTITKEDKRNMAIDDKFFDEPQNYEISFVKDIKSEIIEDNSKPEMDEDFMVINLENVKHSKKESENDLMPIKPSVKEGRVKRVIDSSSDSDLSDLFQVKKEKMEEDVRSERRKTRSQRNKGSNFTNTAEIEKDENISNKRKTPSDDEATSNKRKPLSNKTNNSDTNSSKRKTRKRENRFKNCDLSIFDFE
ncbi:uncharacterized protein KGF55_003061 [Candida pseudojiufengensis]|uniref:uncharacterized protein n=1 Tax=Candida pseudojiufengensis TaxID=497109 RepID=UPI0022244041|nr:uncharacterized protein KGF55_003061 [Candida pseudojiufengensis]KAI5963269.1 hypothetical protein KGF55_003061 [Candida pseudojiufengensis]